MNKLKQLMLNIYCIVFGHDYKPLPDDWACLKALRCKNRGKEL